MQKLESEPQIEQRAFNRACDQLRPRDVDAARLKGLAVWLHRLSLCRCLHAGIVRPRMDQLPHMRAMLVSFASYHLWLDWHQLQGLAGVPVHRLRTGDSSFTNSDAKWPNRHQHAAHLQPDQAGRGPRFRGDFIRHWVHELRRVPGADVPGKLPEHKQVNKCRLGVDYPLPIVDHREAVRHARACFSALRKRDDYWDSARAVMKRHGSRKQAVKSQRPQRPPRRQDMQLELTLPHACKEDWWALG